MIAGTRNPELGQAAADRIGARFVAIDVNDNDSVAPAVEDRPAGTGRRLDRFGPLPQVTRLAWNLGHGQAVFCQTETCLVLSLVNGSRSQPAHRSRKVIPASRAIRSSSAGHT